MTILGDTANFAAILTALVAVGGYGYYHYDLHNKSTRLEKYLKSEKKKKKDHGQRSLLHLMAGVGMTEAELLQASFSNKHISRKIAPDEETGRAKALLLEWTK